MARVSYVITVHNHEQYIVKVIDSLKKINGEFKKEYIFVNDGSNDDSLALIRQHAKELPNTTIISRKNNGVSTFANEGIFLARGDYIKFVAGNDVLDPNSTLYLLTSLSKHAQRVAFGMHGKYDHRNGHMLPNNEKSFEKVISNPISALLKAEKKSIRTIGSSASIIARDLIDEISCNDNEIFIHDFFLAFRCATKSNFVFCPKTICYTPIEPDKNSISSHKKFEAYNRMFAIRKFIDFDLTLADKYKKEIYSSIISMLCEMNPKNYKFLFRYIGNKFFTPNQTIENLKKLIDNSLKNFF